MTFFFFSNLVFKEKVFVLISLLKLNLLIELCFNDGYSLYSVLVQMT